MTLFQKIELDTGAETLEALKASDLSGIVDNTSIVVANNQLTAVGNGKAAVNSSDTANYLVSKLIAGSNIELSVVEQAPKEYAIQIDGATQSGGTLPHVYYVSSFFPEGIQNCYQTIQAALDAIPDGERWNIVVLNQMEDQSETLTIDKAYLTLIAYNKLYFQYLTLTGEGISVYGAIHVSNAANFSANNLYIQNLKYAESLSISGSNNEINFDKVNTTLTIGASASRIKGYYCDSLSITGNSNNIDLHAINSSIELNNSSDTTLKNEIHFKKSGAINRINGSNVIYASDIIAANNAITNSARDGQLRIVHARIQSGDSATILAGDGSTGLYLDNCKITSLSNPISIGRGATVIADNCIIVGGTSYSVVGTSPSILKNYDSRFSAAVSAAVTVQGDTTPIVVSDLEI